MSTSLPALMGVSLLAVGAAACSSSTHAASPSPSPQPVQVAQTTLRVFARVPATVGLFKLTERAAVRGMPTDSLFRYRDTTKTNLTVFIYDIIEDTKVDADSQKWAAREGDKFRAVEGVLKQRGQLVGYTVALEDSSRFTTGGHKLLEHMMAVAVRYPDGFVGVEFQYLYLIEGKFVQVRATVPADGWQRSEVPGFARALAARLAGGS